MLNSLWEGQNDLLLYLYTCESGSTLQSNKLSFYSDCSLYCLTEI